MAKIGWGKWLAGAVAVAAGGAAYVYLRQRQANTPIHTTILSDGAFEIRQYPALMMLETLQHGSRDRALGNGFGLMADYMFGESRDGAEIPIAVPFFAVPLSEGRWKIRFILPADQAREGFPALGEGLDLVDIPPREMAAISFPAKLGEAFYGAKERDLSDWIGRQGRSIGGGREHAYYNSPLKPGTSRPNELLVPLV
jgi:hypothetical protein